MNIFYQIIISLVVFIISNIFMIYFFEPIKLQFIIRKKIIILFDIYKADILSFKKINYSTEKAEKVHREFKELSSEFRSLLIHPAYNYIAKNNFLYEKEKVNKICMDINFISYYPYNANECSLEEIIKRIKNLENELNISILHIK